MNYTVIPARKSCNKCGNMNNMESKHCSGCGVSFVVGQPDAWKSEPLSSKISSKFEEIKNLSEDDIAKLYKDLEEAIIPEIKLNQKQRDFVQGWSGLMDGIFKSKKKEDKCLHDACTDCGGTGVKEDGSICIHHIACPCSKCTPSV